MSLTIAERDEIRRRLYERYAARQALGDAIDTRERSALLDAACRELGVSRLDALRELGKLREQALTKLQAMGLLSRRGHAVKRTPSGLREFAARRQRMQQEMLSRQRESSQRLQDEIADLEFDGSLEYQDEQGREREVSVLGCGSGYTEPQIALARLADEQARRLDDQDEQERDDRLRQEREEREAFRARWRDHPGYLADTPDERYARP